MLVSSDFVLSIFSFLCSVVCSIVYAVLLCIRSINQSIIGLMGTKSGSDFFDVRVIAVYPTGNPEDRSLGLGIN